MLHLLALERWVHWEHIWWRRRKGVRVVVREERENVSLLIELWVLFVGRLWIVDLLWYLGLLGGCRWFLVSCIRLHNRWSWK